MHILLFEDTTSLTNSVLFILLYTWMYYVFMQIIILYDTGTWDNMWNGNKLCWIKKNKKNKNKKFECFFNSTGINITTVKKML